MADNVRLVSDLITNIFKDGQPSLSITPQDMRDLLRSLRHQYGVMTYAPGALTLTLNTWDEIDLTTTLRKAQGFTNPVNGQLRYDEPPINSITGSADTKAVFVLGFASIEPATGGDVFEFTIGLNGTADAVYAQSYKTVATATDEQTVAFGGVIPAMTTNDYAGLFVRNTTATRNLTVNALTMISLALNV